MISFNFNTAFSQQVLVNQEWTTSTGQPNGGNAILTAWDNFAWSASTLDNAGNLITTGNTLVTAGNTDVLLTKYNTSGQILWQKTFDGGNNGYDYGLAVEKDNWGNFYIAGTTTAANGFLDYFIIKTNSSGTQLWTYTWNGSSNLHDVPSAIYLDNSGNPVIVGGTYSIQDGVDIALVKLSSTGTLLWQSIYDHAGLDDVPLSIKKWNAIGNVLEVSAISASASGQWDVARIRFSALTGGVPGEIRIPIPQLHFQDVHTFTSDDEGNLFLASAVQGVITGKDIEVVKVSSSGLDWVETIDYKGLDDLPKSIAVDNNGNVFLSASAEKLGGIDILTIKMDTDGNELWRQAYLAPKNQKIAEPVKIKTDDNGNLFVTGLVKTQNGVQDYATFMYDESGTLRFDLKLDANNGSIDTPTDIVLSASGDEFFVTGEAENGGSMTYVTVKYEKRKEDNGTVLVAGQPHHKANELIVKFRPEFVNTIFVDDRNKRFGDIDEILPNSVILFIENKLNFVLSKAEISKVFYRLTTSHQSSITRLGETVPIPKFWSTFLFKFPVSSNIETLMAGFNQISEYVEYAEYNYIYEEHTIPNDNFITTGEQASLLPTADFPDAHINMNPAWDLETGQSNVRVGVYDSAIFWGHPDFGDGTLAGSQVAGGWDFFNNAGLAAMPQPNKDHGTKVAGIIGALRDNAIGVAGIAGGGLDAENNFNPGVQLFSMGISEWVDCNGNGVVDFGWIDCDGDGFIDQRGETEFTTANIAPAIIEGAMFVPGAVPTGYGLHVQNYSWSSGAVSSPVESAVYFSFRNQSIIIASRGNNGTEDLRFPACHNDDWVINVGASGTDGEWHGDDNGDLLSTGESWWNSSFGGGVDFIAPGVTDLITSTTNTGNVDPDGIVDPFDGSIICLAANNYDCFNGTSAAAPHVAGVVALMLSLHNVDKVGKTQWNNLAPEDVERLLEIYAFDIAGNFPVGYDVNNGWGRIDAGATIEVLEAPSWRVFHNSEPQSTTVVEGIGYSDYLPPPSPFIVKPYTVTHTYQDIFSSSTNIVDAWVRRSSTIGGNPIAYNGDPAMDLEEDWVDITFSINQNVATVTAVTHCWEFINVSNNETFWVPAPPNEIRTTYSLHLHDPLASGTKEVANIGIMKIMPNPSSGIFTISFDIPNEKHLSLHIYDAIGKLIISKNIPAIKNDGNSIEFDLSTFTNGLYLCQIIGDKGVLSQQIIKQ